MYLSYNRTKMIKDDYSLNNALKILELNQLCKQVLEFLHFQNLDRCTIQFGRNKGNYRYQEMINMSTKTRKTGKRERETK